MAAARFPLNQRTRAAAIEAIRSAPDGHYFMPPKAPTRTLDQNAKLWAMLGDISRQVQWPVNGKLMTLPPDDWKAIATASLAQENRMAQGIRGGFVMLGQSTSGMTLKEMIDLIDFLYAFGAEKGVQWSEPIEVPGWVR